MTIGLLSPARKSEAGYRLYDDSALEALRQILLFRGFDMPLQTIKSVMENPALDRDQILQMQRTMLAAKKERLERLIEGLDDILQDLISRRGCAVDSLAVREIIGRYGVAKRRLCQVKEEAGVMLSLATSYQNDQVRRIIDERYGDGAAAFFARSIQSVYQ